MWGANSELGAFDLGWLQPYLSIKFGSGKPPKEGRDQSIMEAFLEAQNPLEAPLQQKLREPYYDADRTMVSRFQYRFEEPSGAQNSVGSDHPSRSMDSRERLICLVI